jgi:hypothetical protein
MMEEKRAWVCGRTSTSLASASMTDTWRVLWRVRYRVAVSVDQYEERKDRVRGVCEEGMECIGRF